MIELLSNAEMAQADRLTISGGVAGIDADGEGRGRGGRGGGGRGAPRQPGRRGGGTGQ